LIGIPAGAITGLATFPGRGFIITLSNTFMGLPPVVVGLFVYLILSRSGPLGFIGLLYTPSAMIIAQMILALPIVTSLCHSAIVNVDPIIGQAGNAWRNSIKRLPSWGGTARYFAGIIAGLGRVMAEVGADTIVGGTLQDIHGL
jgi:tungstate transport system permease protein